MPKPREVRGSLDGLAKLLLTRCWAEVAQHEERSKQSLGAFRDRSKKVERREKRTIVRCACCGKQRDRCGHFPSTALEAPEIWEPCPRPQVTGRKISTFEPAHQQLDFCYFVGRKVSEFLVYKRSKHILTRPKMPKTSCNF